MAAESREAVAGCLARSVVSKDGTLGRVTGRVTGVYMATRAKDQEVPEGEPQRDWWMELEGHEDLDWKDVDPTAILTAIRIVGAAGAKLTFFIKSSNGHYGCEVFYQGKAQWFDEMTPDMMENRLRDIITVFDKRRKAAK